MGLKNLTILENTIEVIEKIHGKKYDLDTLPMADLTTFKLLQRGDTTGVFQLESAGMKRYLKQLKPSILEDIIAMVALYRPGPMELIPDFIARKHGQKKIEYIHPKLEPVLGQTYGIGVYQEQMMRIAQDLAGFTLAEADTLRKAIGKKIQELLNAQEEKLISGMIKNGIDHRVAKEIWELFPPFAKYGFNRSHAACYAIIAYQTAYFKANYPVEFMASLLTSDQHDLDRVTIEVDDCKQMGIEVLPPDINESFTTFTAVAESLGTKQPRIRFGLSAIKNFGESAAKAVIHDRKANGPYRDFEDFLLRMSPKDLNKKALESLAKAGALDGLIERNAVLYNLEKILRFSKEAQAASDSAQVSLFSATSVGPALTLQLDPVPSATKRERGLWEKEYLGLYVTEHPYKEFAQELSAITARCSQLGELLKQGHEGVRVAGVITARKKIFTRKGDAMLFIRIEDGSGSAELILFPSIVQSVGERWLEDTLVLVEGRLSDKDGEMKVVVERGEVVRTEQLETIMQNYRGPIRLRNGYHRSESSTSPSTPPPARLSASPEPTGPLMTLRLLAPPEPPVAEQIKTVIGRYPGPRPVWLLIQHQGKWQRIKTPFSVNDNPDVGRELETLIGPGSVLVDR